MVPNARGGTCGASAAHRSMRAVNGMTFPDSEFEATEPIDRAVELAVRFGGIGGDHHKAWVIDQMVRVLTGPMYETVVREACDGEDGPNTYDWDVGITP